MTFIYFLNHAFRFVFVLFYLYTLTQKIRIFTLKAYRNLNANDEELFKNSTKKYHYPNKRFTPTLYALKA